MRHVSSRLGIVLTLLILALPTAHAQARQRPGFTKRQSSYADCMQRADTNVDFDECGGKEMARQESLLTSAWRAALTGFAVDPNDPPEYSEEVRLGRQALLDEQRAWIKYKDLACAHWLHGEGREGVVIGFNECKIRVIANRVEHLRRNFPPNP